jgi:HD-GYP domain-containing protein (c-di-GMP phosphodiesterase class II)
MARILAVADMYEALTADRPYRPGLPPETVLQILRGETPALHDPAVLEALECCVRADAAEAERPVRAGPIG